MMSPSILITGGAGFIGSNLVEFYLDKGWRVVAFDDFSTGSEKNISSFLNNPDFTVVEGDIRDYDFLLSTLQRGGIEYISHQAARGSVPKSIENPVLTNDINVSGTLNVLWAAKNGGIKKVVCAISSSVYGDTEELPKHEAMPCRPKSPYAVSKVAKEHYCRVFSEVYGLPVVGLRYFNVYGRKQDPNGPYAAVIPRFISAAISNQPLTIYGDGEQTRDFTYIDDVLQANDCAISSETAAGKSLNVAYGQRISIRELAESICTITDSKSEIIFTGQRRGDVRDSLASLENAQKYLGYRPEYPLETGLTQTVEWYRKDLMKKDDVSLSPRV